MYTPNIHLDAAHQRLLQATSDEAAGAAVQTPDPTAHYYDAWQHLPNTPLPLHEDHPFATRQALSLRPDTNASFGHEVAHPPKLQPWQIDSAPQYFTDQHIEQRLPSPPLRNDHILPDVLQIDPKDYVSRNGTHQRSLPVEPNFTGLPYDLLPQTREYPVSTPSFFTPTGPDLAGTDGADGGRNEWALNGQPLSPYYAPNSNAWEQQQVVDHHPQIPDYSNQYRSPKTSPIWQDSLALHFAEPRRVYSIASSPTSFQHHGQQSHLPPIQEWRTDNLPAKKTSRRRLPDASTVRKQEIYRLKGEARRKTIAAGMAETQTLAGRPQYVGENEVPKLAKPRKKRRKIAAKPADSDLGSATDSSHGLLPDIPGTDALQPADTVIDITAVQPPLPSVDELPQSIVSTYEDYKWSVYRYELLPAKGYHHAEPFIHSLFESVLQAEYKDRHVSHISQGFIQDGGPLSIIVLHNAANPFEYEPSPSSTVSIGMYGYHWYQHNQIHWTTLASDQRLLFLQCVQSDYLVQTHKWTFDNPKASERRFHRAYWLAANRLDLKGMLNRGPSNDTAQDSIEEKSEEDPDKDFAISEADLTSECEVSDVEAAVAWQKIVDEVDRLVDAMDVGDAGWQHLVTSNTEW